jgi:hypothetical protein
MLANKERESWQQGEGLPRSRSTEIVRIGNTNSRVNLCSSLRSPLLALLLCLCSSAWDLGLDLGRCFRNIAYRSMLEMIDIDMEHEWHTLELLLGNLWASASGVEVVAYTTSCCNTEVERDSGLWLGHCR